MEFADVLGNNENAADGALGAGVGDLEIADFPVLLIFQQNGISTRPAALITGKTSPPYLSTVIGAAELPEPFGES